MALFSIKKNTDEKDQKDASVEAKKTKAPAKKTDSSAPTLAASGKDLSSVLLNPRVTEKATVEAQSGVYVFDISPRATKTDVAEAVKALYKVTPRKVAIVQIPSKRVRMRGGRNLFGRKGGGKKAYVFVKAGDTIDIV